MVRSGSCRRWRIALRRRLSASTPSPSQASGLAFADARRRERGRDGLLRNCRVRSSSPMPIAVPRNWPRPSDSRPAGSTSRDTAPASCRAVDKCRRRDLKSLAVVQTDARSSGESDLPMRPKAGAGNSINGWGNRSSLCKPLHGRVHRFEQSGQLLLGTAFFETKADTISAAISVGCDFSIIPPPETNLA